MASTDNIPSFWNWFSTHEAALAAKSIPPEVIAELEERLFAIARLDWELGPGRSKTNMFALSPNGNRENLQLTRSIVSGAPDLAEWEFYPAKPPRNWNLVFKLRADNAVVEVDGKGWGFVAYKFDDGTYDLVFKPDHIQGLSDDYLNWAATIIVDGELGEEKRMNAIGNIEAVKTWDEKSAHAARKMEVGLLGKVIE